MTFIKNAFQRIKYVTVAVLLLLATTLSLLATQHVSAQPLSNRSLMVTSTVASDDLDAPDGSQYVISGPGALSAGDPRNGQRVGHKYTFTASTDQDLEGFTIEYCDSAFGYIGVNACLGIPSGFTASNWNGGTVNVTSPAGTKQFTVAATTNTITLTSNDPLLVNENEDIIIEFPASTSNYFINPDKAYKASSTNGTYFAHIKTYSTEAAANNGITNDSGFVDDGTVTNNVTTAISIYTRVQETLNFSVEGDQDGIGGTPDGPSSAYSGSGPCTALTASGQLKMGDLNHALSTQSTSKAKSYFRLSTNSAFGTTVFYTGTTLQSNNHGIAAPAAQTPSEIGEEQFGIAFDLTDGANNVGNGSQLTPEPDYNNNANGYAFNGASPSTPKILARTTSGGVKCDTGAIEYIANISPDTPAGIYQTKINYIASPSY